MLGCAAESVTLEVRDTTIRRMTVLSIAVPKGLADWKLKAALNALHTQLVSRKGAMPKELREGFEAFWPALVQQIRIAQRRRASG